MRSKDFGTIKNLSSKFDTKLSLAVFKKMCFIRHFELGAQEAFDQGLIKMPIYLSVGQESIAAALSLSYKKPYIFAQHRCHDIYLAYGGDPQALADELLHKSSGIAGGMGGSASIHSPKNRMFGHSGLMGDQVPIAVGYALGSGRRVLTIMGDASAEEDYIFGAFGMAITKKLPVLFVCADNGLSILTKVEVRRSWSMVDVATGFGIPSVEITDDPWLIMHHVKKLLPKLPAFLNIHTVRHLWHSGTGRDSQPEWDRMALVKRSLVKLGHISEMKKIESNIENDLKYFWKQRLTAF